MSPPKSVRLPPTADILWEISEEAAAKALADQPLDLGDIRCARRVPPTCKKNGVQVKGPDGEPLYSTDLYYDDQTGQWMIAFPQEQYVHLRRHYHPHDSLGVLPL